MSPKSLKLCADVDAVASVMSEFVHPSRSIRHKYPNRPNNHKLQGVILVEVDTKVVRRGANAIMVFVFTHFDFPDEQFYAAKRYIHVNQEGEEDSLFVLAEDFVPAASAGGIGPLAVDGNNIVDGAEANDAPILLSGCTSNLRLEDMVELFRQGIAIDDDKDTAPDNVPIQGETTLAPVVGGERVLFSPVKPATFKIISLLSDIIPMMPSFVCHCFGCFLLCSQMTILRNSSFPRPKRGRFFQWIFKSL